MIQLITNIKTIKPLLVAIFVNYIVVSTVFGYDKDAPPAALEKTAPVDAKPIYSGNWHAREGVYFQRNWGVDIVGVKPVASGYMLDFRFRVLDPKKALLLNNKKTRPYLIDEASGIRLAVPSMENIGELRQTGEPELHRTYFIIFGNPGKLVKAGSRVSVVIGDFRVNGLTVN